MVITFSLSAQYSDISWVNFLNTKWKTIDNLGEEEDDILFVTGEDNKGMVLWYYDREREWKVRGLWHVEDGKLYYTQLNFKMEIMKVKVLRKIDNDTYIFAGEKMSDGYTKFIRDYNITEEDEKQFAKAQQMVDLLPIIRKEAEEDRRKKTIDPEKSERQTWNNQFDICLEKYKNEQDREQIWDDYTQKYWDKGEVVIYPKDNFYASARIDIGYIVGVKYCFSNTNDFFYFNKLNNTVGTPGNTDFYKFNLKTKQKKVLCMGFQIEGIFFQGEFKDMLLVTSWEPAHMQKFYQIIDDNGNVKKVIGYKKKVFEDDVAWGEPVLQFLDAQLQNIINSKEIRLTKTKQ